MSAYTFGIGSHKLDVQAAQAIDSAARMQAMVKDFGGGYAQSPMRKAEWAFGEAAMVMRGGAYSILVPLRRPPVNPWRHAYVRAKHFRRAAHHLIWNTACYRIIDGAKTGDWSAYERIYGPINTYSAAAENADWGCA